MVMAIVLCTSKTTGTAHQRGATPAQHHLALLILSWQMQSSALPLTLRPTPPLCGASSLAVDTAAHAAPLRRKQPWTGRQPPHLSCYPWWNPRCFMLQLREAKLFWPRSPYVRLLERRYQTHLRHSRSTFATVAAPSPSVSAFAQREVGDFSQLLRTNPRRFWQAGRLPNDMLPQELHDPTTSNNLGLVPQQPNSTSSTVCNPPASSSHASASHATAACPCAQPQPPAPAHNHRPLPLRTASISLSLWLRLRLAYSGCTMAGQEPCTATPRSCCVMPSLWPHLMTQRQRQLTYWHLAFWCRQLTYWHLAFWCYSMLPSAQGRCPNPGRLP